MMPIQSTQLRSLGVAIAMALPVLACGAKQTTVKNEAGASPPPSEEVAVEKPTAPAFVMPEADAAYYETAVATLAAGTVEAIEAVDFTKFRFSFLEWKKEGIPEALETALSAAQESRDFAEQVALADKILAYDYTDIRIHLFKSYAQDAMGLDAGFHTSMVKALLDSIVASGDGRTTRTAFHVAQVKEEYALIHILGLERQNQMLLSEGDRSFDLLQCVDENGASFEIYFDITVHMARLQALLTGE